MDRINPYAFYQLALNLRGCSNFGLDDKGVPSVTAFLPLFALNSALGELLDGDPIEVRVSRHAAQDLKKYVEEIINQYYKDESGKWRFPGQADEQIPEWRWSSLRTNLQTLEHVFRAEMLEATTYRIPQRGIYSTPSLVEAAETTFPTDLSALVPQKAKLDFNAAGRCLAFNLLTAAGFHVVRAVEGMLEEYYALFTGSQETLKGWHDYIVSLESVKTAPMPDKKTLNNLRQVKDDWRNPVAHPRVVLTEADARILFSMGEACITGMAQEVKQIKSQTGIQLSLVAPTS